VTLEFARKAGLDYINFSLPDEKPAKVLVNRWTS
jgi:hypothetical protein